MDIALAIVDFWQNLSICLSAGNHLPTRNPWTEKQPDWSCGLTARKAGNYQRSSKQKRHRTVPADRVYYIQMHIHFSETAQESMEDKIIHLIGNETMDTAPEYGIIELPQMSRQPEGSTT